LFYELPELDALLHRETSVTKAFLSRPADRFRRPYGRAPEVAPRSVVFCGTVNHGGYLKDQTGNRRFWVIRSDGALDVAGIGRARNALWAEARHLFEAGEAWHLDAADEATMREEHATRLEADPWEEVIAAWVTARGCPGEAFTMTEVLETALAVGAQGRNPNVTRRVSRILELLGFERRRARVAGRSGTRGYAYVPVGSPACPTGPTVPLQAS
jgi:putative DNA primase/helicase